MSSILSARNLNKIFNTGASEVHVLKDISVDIQREKFTLITGPSGCGKSTLLHCLLGLEVPTSGDVFFEKQNVYDLSEDEITDLRNRNIGIIQQQSNWVKALNVVENVAIPALLRGETAEEATDKAEKSLAIVGMQHWAGYSPVELSSGQQQKIALARALVNDCPILVMDEPTGNLDQKSSNILMDLVSLLVSSKSFTVIMITHELRFKSYAHDVVEMIDGVLV